MTEFDAYWSEQAREEFAALFDDEAYSPRFRKLVAEALVRGWSNNKDRPFWTLAVVISVLGLIYGDSNDDADGLSIVARSNNELWQTISEVAQQGDQLADVRLSTEDAGRILIATPIGSTSLSKTRLAVLRKIAEFLIVCDDFGFARQVREIFDRLSSTGFADAEVVLEQVRALSRLAYAYRSKHFQDTSAQSAFGLLMQFLSSQSSYELSAESVVQFWVWDENNLYRTYSSAFGAFADFYDALNDINANRELANVRDIAEPALQSQLASEDDPESILIASEDVIADAMPHLTEEATPTELATESVAGDDTKSADLIDSSPMKLLSHKDLRLLRHMLELGNFGLAFPRASLRLISFHPVQSGLSNALRTGRSKLTLDERLKCVEAVPYEEVRASAKVIEERMKDLLMAALARRAPKEDEENDQLAEIREKGVIVLATVKARRGGMDGTTASDQAWLAVEPALVAAKSVASAFCDRIDGMERNESEADKSLLAPLFEADKAVFSAHLTLLYKENDNEDSR